MPTKSPRIPSYRLHAPSGQARVIIDGRHIYLGKFGSTDSWEKYHQVVTESLASRRQLPPTQSEAADLTVVEVLARYKRFAVPYYRKNGEATGEWEYIKMSIAPLRKLYGRTLVKDFGPLALKAVRQTMIEAGLSRQGINARVNRIKRVFRWAVSEELAPATLVHALSTVAALKASRTVAPETKPVGPVPDEVVDKTLPHLPQIVADMVRFQRFTGCRPGEVCSLRPCDLDCSGDAWRYVPSSHKTEHHGKQRIIFVGPRAQAVLLPYLSRDADAYCFSPAESERVRKAGLREKRKTKVQPSQIDRSRRNPKRRPGTRYRTRVYGHAIRQACEAANVDPWSPNRLRHTAATELRSRFGLEATRTVLGHSSPATTLIYAERDLELAAKAMREVG